SVGFNHPTLNAARSLWAFLTAVASVIKTNDDLIGIAVANSVTGYYSPDANWAWIGENSSRTGWVNLEMR
ncbi:MAG TPA: hypothetical protein VFI13_11005, partial [Gemmatimonadales bacterium]|nr:hypothetical protein [Gemmatimonadales bacterium]